MSDSLRRSGPILLAALALAACGRRVPLAGGSKDDGGAAVAGSGGAAGSTSGAGGSTNGVDGAASRGEVGAGPTPGLDPGRVAIHRLNNTEYDNTIRDLLGVDAHARDTFIPDERGEFDNEAEAFTLNDARYEQYFLAADALTTQVFADDKLRARVVTCAPGSGTEMTCPRDIILAFGLRAWRRPLTEVEVEGLLELASAARSEGLTFEQSIARVVRAMLSAAPFLYRLEFDAEPTSLAVHPLSSYELATRLSYLLWSSMPDARLFGLAGEGSLSRPEILAAEVDRLLADPRAAAFVESFAGQWLGIRYLQGHQVEPTAFPLFDEALRTSMVEEMRRYFSEFLSTDRSFATFPSADFNVVDARLAAHYGFPTKGLGADFVRVENTSDRRKGLLGLAGFLTQMSYSYRTSPTFRGKWILDQLLCTNPPPPPPNIPSLDPPGDPAQQPRNLRQRVEAISADQSCATCHRLMDPIGLALEEFDGIGHFRTTDTDGTPIDPNVVLSDGAKISGESPLADWVARDPRFLDCVSHKLMTYALSRALREVEDTPHVARVRDAWTREGLTLRALLKEIVLDDTFRFRRGEASP